MSKARETRAKIIRQAAELFNQKGYAASSISDIMQATGLKKGGIYNHFKSKEELALYAFDYAVERVSSKIWRSAIAEKSAKERLQAMLASYADYIDEPPIAGGCPILNTAVEIDDTDSVLRDRTLRAMNSWRRLIVRILQKGIEKEEVPDAIEPDFIATIIIATIEGAMMMSKLERDSIHLRRALNYLHDYLEETLEGS